MLLIKDVSTHLIVSFCSMLVCIAAKQLSLQHTYLIQQVLNNIFFKFQTQSDPHGYKDSKHCS